MHDYPMLALIKQGVLLSFFLIFMGLIWWTFLRSGNAELEQHRFDVILEEGQNG